MEPEMLLDQLKQDKNRPRIQYKKTEIEIFKLEKKLRNGGK